MDLRKTPDDQKLQLCRKYFYGGFALLPFLWLVNTIWFMRDAFFREEFAERKELRKYVIRSGIGTLVWFIAIVIWVTFYQLNRASWGELGDTISFLIPLGRP
eukprot:Seg4119.2 transcript_id=Seg4119.2/GoldUCD/mRNA.D3Y31 product="Gamma-secretase subunit pen-2" protein_id=Seg4119.2/GoldUCD/D3Y31